MRAARVAVSIAAMPSPHSPTHTQEPPFVSLPAALATAAAILFLIAVAGVAAL